MSRKSNLWNNLDWVTVLIYLFMVFAGWFNIYSAVYNEDHQSIFDISQRYGQQLIWIIFAFIIGFFIIVVDSKFYVTFSYLFYALLIVLLVFVLFFGREVNASKSWIVIGNFQFQPAEFAKLATSLAIAKLLSAYNFTFNRLKYQASIVALIFIPVVLILLQNDTGSAIVYAVFIIPLFREGMSGLILFFAVLFALLFIFSLMLNPLVLLLILLALAIISVLTFRRMWNETFVAFALFLLVSLLVGLVSYLVNKQGFQLYNVLLISSLFTSLVFIVVAIYKRMAHIPLIFGVFIASVLFTLTVDYVFDEVLAKHQRERIENFLGVETDPLVAGYHVAQSKIAIGSGGFAGKGFLQGTQTKYNFVPEQDTDFIFCTVGEEWGFVGSVVVVMAFLFLLIRLVLLAERQRSVYSRVFGYCVASVFFFHFSINIGMTIGLTPVIGIPLPFFSYGGSSLWFFTMFLFIFLRLDASRLEQLH
jgi:rod shape determining protein RodA